MELYPEYSENIIIFLVSNGNGSWYVTEKETWFLDRVALSKAYGVEPEPEDFLLLEDLINGNGSKFKDKISEFEVDTNELKVLIEAYPPLEEDESILEMRPSLYVDLDKKVLKNLFPEPSGVFEKYAPNNWDAFYEDFWHLIPLSNVYWVIDGKSKFQ